ncbi:MAG: hypothetical protein AUG48_04465 [Actinobacteria bacterium 13_1_20CM_3_68_9]|nr:MAG: hypothetical protein AUG48_04465 [Actinobacteria bacterium 13_1_20CM_3_68_9]
MLKLRRGVVLAADPLTVEVAGEERPAWADRSLVGEVTEGDEVIVNTEALDLGLGSGGFDVVHVNLTGGLAGGGATGDRHVIKLNYTSLQHPVEPVEVALGEGKGGPAGGQQGNAKGSPTPVLVLPLHGHLGPACWAAGQARPGLRVGYVQTAGGALPGSLSRDVGELRDRGLLAGHVTAAPAYGGEHEAISLVGALDAAVRLLGWDAIVCGPGPGILGSATPYGHGGLVALDSAHAALALRLPTLLSPRLSSTDPRPRHRGLSHHTASVLELLLASVRIPVPEIELEGWPTGTEGVEEVDLPSVLDALHRVCADRHDVAVEPVDLKGYAASGLPALAMGRTIAQDPLFFAAALAGGAALVGAVRVSG